MQEDIINKIFKTNTRLQIDKSIIINTINIPFRYLNTIKLKNTYTTDISTKSDYNDLFFEYFPYQTTSFETKNDLLPQRFFFNSSNTHSYLLTQNSQKETKEYCPYLNFIKNLKFFGTLKQKKDKSVYLEIDDNFFINLISTTLKDNRIAKLNNFNINIISKDEYEKHVIFPISEIDQKYEFRIKDLYSININEEENTQKLWFLEIESKELEEFRYKYHLFPKINGYNFSIILGFINYFKLRKSYPKMKINITFCAA